MPKKDLGLSINVGEVLDAPRGARTTRTHGGSKSARQHRGSDGPATTGGRFGAATTKTAQGRKKNLGFMTPRARPMSETPEHMQMPPTQVGAERWLRRHLDLQKERDNLAKLKPFRDAVASWPDDSIDPRTGTRAVMGTHKLLAAKQDTHNLHQVAEMYHRKFEASRQKTSAEVELTAAQAAYASLGLTNFEICVEEYSKVDSVLNGIRKNNQFRPPAIKISTADDLVQSLDKVKDRYYTTRTTENTRRLGSIGVPVQHLPFAQGGPTENRETGLPVKKNTGPEISAEEEELLREQEEAEYRNKMFEEMEMLERVASGEAESGKDPMEFSASFGSHAAGEYLGDRQRPFTPRAYGGTGVAMPAAAAASATKPTGGDKLRADGARAAAAAVSPLKVQNRLSGSLTKSSPTMRGGQVVGGGFTPAAAAAAGSGAGLTSRMRWSEIADERKVMMTSTREDPAPEAAYRKEVDDGAYQRIVSTRRRAQAAEKLEGVEQMSAFVSSSSMYSPERRRGVRAGGSIGVFPGK